MSKQVLAGMANEEEIMSRTSEVNNMTSYQQVCAAACEWCREGRVRCSGFCSAMPGLHHCTTYSFRHGSDIAIPKHVPETVPCSAPSQADWAEAQAARLTETQRRIKAARDIVTQSEMQCHYSSDDGGDSECRNIDDCIYHALLAELEIPK